MTRDHSETTPLTDRGRIRKNAMIRIGAVILGLAVILSSIMILFLFIGGLYIRREQESAEEATQRLGLYWDTLIADSHCTTYNTREYWARLLNTGPYDYNWLRPCQDIPITIHGRSIKTSRCYINPSVRFPCSIIRTQR